MGEYLLISDAAKQVKVESHVLRYWMCCRRKRQKKKQLPHRVWQLKL